MSADTIELSATVPVDTIGVVVVCQSGDETSADWHRLVDGVPIERRRLVTVLRALADAYEAEADEIGD